MSAMADNPVEKPSHPYLTTLKTRFKGVLKHGSHSPDGEACALEVVSIAKGLTWTDSPITVGMPDLRTINDAGWSSDEVRTEHMTPVILAYWDWAEWSEERKKVVMVKLAKLTIQRVLPIALRACKLDAEAERCEKEGTYEAASAASDAARAASYAARAASYAASAASDAASYAASDAASDAASAASDAAGDQVLIESCKCWLEAVEA